VHPKIPISLLQYPLTQEGHIMKEFIEKQVQDFKEGDNIKGKFAVRTKDTPRDYKNKQGKYFFLNVGDKTGNISLKYWGGPDEGNTMQLYNSLNVGDVIEIKGDVAMDRFDNILTINCEEGQHRINKCAEGEYDPEGFLPSSMRDIEGMMDELHTIIDSISEDNLKSLLEAFFSDENLVNSFKKSPAAMMHHHSFLGGLLEHTLNVVKQCDMITSHYPALNRDLLLTGAILHDLGKIHVYRAQTSIDITDTGRFIGHITLTSSMINDKISSLGPFPEILRLKLEHMILNHHGNVESVSHSPKGLKIPEAWALYHADQLDANVNEFLQEMEREKKIEDNWVYLRSVGSEVYTK
jgi:3'-5' exoribonuclease